MDVKSSTRNFFNDPARVSCHDRDDGNLPEPVMCFSVDRLALRGLVQEILREMVGLLDWPSDRLALDEAEAAAACGVARHVLRDLRLSGKINARKLGRKIVYTRGDLLTALALLNEPHVPAGKGTINGQ